MATDKGIRGYYLVIAAIKEELLSNPNIQQCTFGDITDIDLQKQTMFPLAHIIIDSCTNSEKTLDFSFTILTMEQIDSYNQNYDTDIFETNTNVQDILNTQLAVSNRLITRLRSGDLYKDGFQLLGDASCEPFFDRFENILAGWATTFTVSIINDIHKC